MISDDDFNISVSVTLTVFMLLLLGLPIAMIAVGKLLFTDEQVTKFVFASYFNIFTRLAYYCSLESNGAVGLPSKAFKMHNLIETSR